MTQSVRFSPAQWDVAQMVVSGMPLDQVAARRGTDVALVHRPLDVLQDIGGVLTLRALCYQLLEQGLLPVPPVRTMSLDLDQDTRAVWEALRWDILDCELVPSVAMALSLSEQSVAGALDRLTQAFRTSPHGLIRHGFAVGVLGRGMGVAPPVHTGVVASPPREGAWDPAPSARRALALRAGGRDTAACAGAEGVSRLAIVSRLGQCQSLAGRNTHRVLVHQGFLDQVLVRPAPAGPAEVLEMPEEERLVWRHLILDVSQAKLPVAIAGHTCLSLDTVLECLRSLRARFADDCAAVVQGWRHGLLSESTPVLEKPLRAVKVADLGLTTRQIEVLSLLTVGGLNRFEAAARLDMAPSTVDGHKQSCMNRAETRSLRALTQWALAGGLLAPMDAGDRDPGQVPDDVEKVWRHLALNVPDRGLKVEIAGVTGLPRHQVYSCLKELRSSGLTDPQLVAAGWHRLILGANSPTSPATVSARPSRPVWTPRPRSETTVAPRSHGNESPPNQLVDSMGILPHPYQGNATCSTAVVSAARRAVSGREFDFLRTDPATCRAFLSRIPAERWGPVIAAPDARMALLVTHVVTDRPVLRGWGGRFPRAGSGVEMPAPKACTGPGWYWAVPPTAPLWHTSDLDLLLTGSGLGNGAGRTG